LFVAQEVCNDQFANCEIGIISSIRFRTFIVMPTAVNRRQVPRIGGPKFDDVARRGLAVRGQA
jgi:hypothetical protein